jgi:L-asparagine transporter-like permease
MEKNNNLNNKKHKGLKAWQLTMMALGTVIGGSFFLGSAIPIKAAGPLIIISFILGGILIYFILFSLSELTVSNPDSGSFRTFATHAFGPGAGFIVGWVYWTGMILGMSSEATAVSILLKQWFGDISVSLFGSIIIIAVTLINLLGADKLSKLESGLAIIKIMAIVAFIITALLLIIGLIKGIPPLGFGVLKTESLTSGGIKGIAGSMLLVIFAYAGFEIIGLAASEAENPQKTVPKAINYTVIYLVGLYVVSIAFLLPLISTAGLSENKSPMVAALEYWGINWAGTALNVILITAILSTMLASMFGLGRMMRSLADTGQAPKWLKDKKDVPYKGILFSGFCMLLALWIGLLLPKVYLFLVSSGGFSVLFTYIIIVACQIHYRKKNGCQGGNCKVPWYPYSSYTVLVCLILIILSMPLIPDQIYGFIAGIILLVMYSGIYLVLKYLKPNISVNNDYKRIVKTEFSDELTDKKDKR